MEHIIAALSNFKPKKEIIIPLLIILMFFWSLVHHFSKIVVAEIKPALVGFLRYAFGAIAILILMIIRKERLQNCDRRIGHKFCCTTKSTTKTRKNDAVVLICFGVLGGIAMLFMLIGLQMSTATNSAILVNTSPLFVTLLAPLLIGEKVTRIQFIGVIIAFIGIVLVTMNGLTISEFLRNELLLGNLAFLASALLISLTIVYGKRYIHIHGALVYTFYSAIGGALALFLYALLSNELLTISKITPIFWLIIIYMGMFVTGFTYALWAYGVKHIGASRATALKLLITLFATLSSVVLLG